MALFVFSVVLFVFFVVFVYLKRKLAIWGSYVGIISIFSEEEMAVDYGIQFLDIDVLYCVWRIAERGEKERIIFLSNKLSDYYDFFPHDASHHESPTGLPMGGGIAKSKESE